MFIARVTLTAMIALLSAASVASAQPWNMATAYSDSTFHTQNIRQFLADIASAGGSDLAITLHNSGTLFKAHEIKRAVQTGRVEIGEILLNGYGNEHPLFEVDAIPFLADDFGSARKLYALQRPALEDLLANQGLRLLFAVPWPAQGFLSEQPLQSVADLDGKRFRIAGPMLARFGKLMGAVPVNIPFSEVPQAFQTGMLDVFVTSATSAVDLLAWDFVGHFTVLGGMHTKNAVVVNASAFDALPDDVQTRILDAAARAETRGWQMSADVMRERTTTLKERGVKVTIPNADFLQELNEIGRRLGAEWAAEAGPAGATLIANMER